MVKRVRKYGDARTTLCAETGNRCFGRTVYEDLQTSDLGVIVNLATGEVLVDLDTFLSARRFFDDVETRPEVDTTMVMFLYGTDDTLIARRIDVIAYDRGVWESADSVWHVVVTVGGDNYFMPLVDFANDRRHMERVEAGLI